ncbi:protein transport protein Sec16B isoform X2 [Rhineura floridana]|uniref:protein transport protein Sec16B isoform X2 n=1 Tax=Rhineura floridana TaxID=261503 RepID=UPI002AC84B3E|nr:protein transport protein Sec16B isoform X2 [Rhineura floridana]
MDSWVPPRQPQPRGRHYAWMEGYDRGPWREVSQGPPPPQSRHNEWPYHHEPWAGVHPWPDARVEPHHPTYHLRLQGHMRPTSRAECYESSYPNQSYSRQGYEDPYRAFSEDYTCGDNQRDPQALWNERDLRQRDTWGDCANYWDQNYYRHHREEGSDFVGHNNLTPISSRKHEAYGDSYISKKDSSSDVSYNSSLQQGQIRDEFQWDFMERTNVPACEVPLPEELPNLLQQYKESGLSSSSYELSQYMYEPSSHYEAAPSKDWSPIQAEDLAATPHAMAPLKFSLPHVPVCFGAGGQLVRGCPNYPADGQPALVEIHSLEVILYDTAEQEAMRVFPGPLIREDLHKVDVMTYCQRRAATGYDLPSNRNRDSALLWKLLLLLCRQNGSMVGSDTAELLMQDCKHRERYKRQEPVANLINLTDEEWLVQGCGTPDLLTGEIVPGAGTPEQRVEKFTKLLFYGRKKEALDWAMRNQLWGHALFLSSKMDLRTYSWVLSGFTSTLAFNDPLQTLFQLMSGRIPQASLCCGDEKWGDWRPHLAVILSNQVGDTELNSRAIVTMGETLAGKGLTEASHFCYLMANIPFGRYGVKTDRMVLLGSSQSQTFAQFARTECIHQTEIFEYCQLLGCPQAFIPSFQVYKLIYASRLVDYGLTAQALHYCEGTGMALLAQKQNTYPVLLEQVIKLADRLKLSDPRLLERPAQEMTLELDWLLELRTRCQQWEEEGLCSATSTQPEFPRISGSIPGLAPHLEFAQSQGCWEDLDQHPSSHLSPVDSAQYQPDVGQRIYLHAGPGHPIDTTDAGLEACLPGSDQGSLSSPGVPDDLSSCHPPGGTVESCGPHHFPGDQKNIPEHQNTLIARTRSISESSTISMVEDIPQSPEVAGEEVTSENLPEDETEQTKASSFGWLNWFRSKPNKEAEPSKKQKAAPPPFLPPIGEMRPPSLPPLPHLPHTDGNPFPKSSPGTKNPLGQSNRKGAMLPDAGDQAPFSKQCSPDHLPPPPAGGTVPLFNPAQVITPTVSRHPQRIFQRQYPPPPQ